jgi:putative transposase
MSHSLTCIWIHATFGTKFRDSLILPEFEPNLHAHIKNQLEEDLGCRVRTINGTDDHVHLLFLLNPNSAVKDILKNVKGESSHWINQESFTRRKFAWQIGYAAYSVSELSLRVVEKYIQTQKEHHRKRTYLEECQEIAREHGLQFSPEIVETISIGSSGSLAHD